MNLVFATHNHNKLAELQTLVPDFIQLKSLDDLGCKEDIVEDAATLEGNALLKARYVKEKYRIDCFADDTGLEVDALNGAPGVYSARYAGEQKNPEDNIFKLLEELTDRQNRKARFRTVIALCIDKKEYTFEGICNGSIIHDKRGDSGFGYDPVFVPETYTETFAEMPLTLKNKIGHRGKAVQKLVDFLSKSI